MSVIRTILSARFSKSVKPLIGLNVVKKLSTSSNIIDSSFPDVSIPQISIPEFIYSKCEKYENLIAAECGITGRKYTYRDILRKSKNLAKALRKKLNLKEGDVVALLLPNVPEFPIAALGVLHAGLVVTTLNPIYTSEEISRQLTDSSAKAIITLIDLYEVASNSSKLLNKALPILSIKSSQTQSFPRGAIDFREFTDNSIDYPEIQPRNAQDVAFLPYSSGTTGLPKGVELTNYNIVANICQNSSPHLPIIEETTSTHQDVIPVVLPMFHIYGFSVNTLFMLSKGTKLVTLPRFTPDDFVSVLRNHKPHILFIVPPIVLFLSAHPMVKSEDLHSVRIAFSGAAPLGALDEQRFVEKAGKSVSVLQGYGLTETSPTVTAITVQLKAEKNVYGSIGLPIPNTSVKVVSIDDHTGTPLGPNSTGELLVKGPQVMKGYLNRPEDTKNTFLDGWLRTGDMAYYNEDRVFFITDRLKELIKVKGFQVAPAELEEIIRDFPNVEDAAVIGVSHPTQGEAPRAYIVPKKNTNVNTKDLEEYFKNKVAHYKHLKGGIAIVDSIPKNASGKIMRRQLKLEFEASNKR
ncbi:probable 4-coumarate--CoA ligase 1 [Tribolium madens]|uniref:probable 4-coumarate--CoA ligase 1 n=1 Tax=Tribolium madens TaxID=41895 RepID=UPI001CF734EA|nr:probable 4-coumarate--CoA ligase 1 [Tribolium madens]